MEQEEVTTNSPAAQPREGELKPTVGCPWCKDVPLDHLEVVEWYPGQKVSFWLVQCPGCDGRGPEEATKADAIEAWDTRADLPRATADSDSYRWGTPQEQAERIVKTWRTTDQHDELLTHSIAQAIRDNAAPRATGETTVEAALAELRGMFPDNRVHVEHERDIWWHTGTEIAHQQRGQWHAAFFVEGKGRDYGEFGHLQQIGSGATIADCMAQVRAAREGEGEKS